METRTDAALFRESLALWDRPLSELRGNVILEAEDDVELIVEHAFGQVLQVPAI